MSAEHFEGVNGSMISLSNPIKHESQPVTPDIPDGSGSGSDELEDVFTERMDMSTDLNPANITLLFKYLSIIL